MSTSFGRHIPSLNRVFHTDRLILEAVGLAANSSVSIYQ